MNEQIRKEFESWWDRSGFNTQLLHWQGNDHYRDGTVQIAWQSYRAAHAKYAGSYSALDQELSRIQSTLESYNAPADALKELIDWHVEVALDPKTNGGKVLVDVGYAGSEWQHARSAKEREILANFVCATCQGRGRIRCEPPSIKLLVCEPCGGTGYAGSAPEPLLAKHQPCGCVICTCENDEQCQGCGAKNCGSHPVGKMPNPVYQHPVGYAGSGEAEETTIGNALAAAQKVWDEQPVKKAVVWAKNNDTLQTLVYTRGEYSEQLITFVSSLDSRPPAQPKVPEITDTAMRRAKLFLNSLPHQDCNEMATLRAMLSAQENNNVPE